MPLPTHPKSGNVVVSPTVWATQLLLPLGVDLGLWGVGGGSGFPLKRPLYCPMSYTARRMCCQVHVCVCWNALLSVHA